MCLEVPTGFYYLVGVVDKCWGRQVWLSHILVYIFEVVSLSFRNVLS